MRFSHDSLPSSPFACTLSLTITLPHGRENIRQMFALYALGIDLEKYKLKLSSLPAELVRELGAVVRNHFMVPLHGPKKSYTQLRYVYKPTTQAIEQAFVRHFHDTTGFPLLDELDAFSSRTNHLRYNMSQLASLTPLDMHVTNETFLSFCALLAPASTFQLPDIGKISVTEFDALQERVNARAGKVGVLDDPRKTPMYVLVVDEDNGTRTLRPKKPYGDCTASEAEVMRQTFHGTVVRTNWAIMQRDQSLAPDVLRIIQPYKTLEDGNASAEIAKRHVGIMRTLLATPSEQLSSQEHIALNLAVAVVDAAVRVKVNCLPTSLLCFDPRCACPWTAPLTFFCLSAKPVLLAGQPPRVEAR